MERPKLDYDKLAGTYHRRYDGGKLDGIEAALVDLAQSRAAKQILEVGCGTGRWIESLRQPGTRVFGADASVGMIDQAAQRLGPLHLIAAAANRLPFSSQCFDLIFAVNAIHHFDDPEDFISQSRKLLRRNGALAIVGIDPRAIRRRYYYDYFDGSFELDIKRYPSFGELVDSMIRAGFEDVELRIVDRSDVSFTGRKIFEDPFLAKRSNSLLALLDDDTYANGLKRIEHAVDQNPQIQFRSDIAFTMITGLAR